MTLSAYVKKMSNCSIEELRVINKAIIDRSDTDQSKRGNRIDNSAILAFFYFESELLGIEALKTVGSGFKYRNIEGQEVQIIVELPESEIGWIYVKKEFREKGLGGLLLSELLRKVSLSHLFALTFPQNKAIHRIMRLNNYSYGGEIKLENSKDSLLYFKKSY